MKKLYNHMTSEVKVSKGNVYLYFAMLALIVASNIVDFMYLVK